MWSVAAALDIIYTEAAVGTGFCGIFATQSRSISVHGIVHHALTPMYGSNVDSGDIIATCSNHL